MLAVRHGLNALRAGADAVALVPPYYYINSPQELLAHYRTVREKVDLPLLVYNIPQNVKVKLEVRTVLTLAEEGTVVGIKDSQNDLDWFRQVMVGARQTGREFRGFLGTRYLIDAGLVAGAHGAIPSIANVAPKLASVTYEAAARGDWSTAAKAQEQLGTLAVRIAGMPSLLPAMKGAMKAMGVFTSARMTLPFHTVTSAEEEKIKALIEEVGVTPRP
jgi:4-hydroxy-tetrahydrodipicolinate synthase